MSSRLRRILTRLSVLAVALLLAQTLALNVARAESSGVDGDDDIDRAPTAAQSCPPGVACAIVGNPGVSPYISTLRVSTDSKYYFQGQPIFITFRVPGPGPIQLIDYQSNGARNVIYSSFDDGRGDTWSGFISPPAGFECVRLRWWAPTGRSYSRVTCFTSYYN